MKTLRQPRLRAAAAAAVDAVAAAEGEDQLHVSGWAAGRRDGVRPVAAAGAAGAGCGGGAAEGSESSRCVLCAIPLPSHTHSRTHAAVGASVRHETSETSRRPKRGL